MCGRRPLAWLAVQVFNCPAMSHALQPGLNSAGPPRLPSCRQTDGQVQVSVHSGSVHSLQRLVGPCTLARKRAAGLPASCSRLTSACEGISIDPRSRKACGSSHTAHLPQHSARISTSKTGAETPITLSAYPLSTMMSRMRCTLATTSGRGAPLGSAWGAPNTSPCSAWQEAMVLLLHQHAPAQKAARPAHRHLSPTEQACPCYPHNHNSCPKP